MGALELDARRREAERLVDREVGGEGPDPGRDHGGVERQRALDGLVDAELHQEHRDGDVEHEPDHTPGMAVGQAREEVRPRDRAGIGVGQVDLELRHEDEQPGEEQGRPAPLARQVAEGHRVHAGRLGSVLGRDAVAQRQDRQRGAEQDLQHPGQDPARAPRQDGQPPAAVAGALRLRHEAQEVDLLADLGEQRQQDAGGEPEPGEIEVGPAAVEAREAGERPQRPRALRRHEDQRQQAQAEPDRLAPDLEPADQPDPVDDEGNHRPRAEQVADAERQPEAELQRQRHDRRLDGEEQEGEARVDQRRDGRAEIAEPRAPGEQVHVDAVPGGVDRDRRRGGEDDQADDQHGRDRVGEASRQRQRPADRLQRQERDRAEGGLRDLEARPAPRLLGGEAEGVILQRLVGDEAVVVPADGDDALRTAHGVPAGPIRPPVPGGRARGRSRARETSRTGAVPTLFALSATPTSKYSAAMVRRMQEHGHTQNRV
jgi:hypothetical protein